MTSNAPIEGGTTKPRYARRALVIAGVAAFAGATAAAVAVIDKLPTFREGEAVVGPRTLKVELSTRRLSNDELYLSLVRSPDAAVKPGETAWVGVRNIKEQNWHFKPCEFEGVAASRSAIQIGDPGNLGMWQVVIVVVDEAGRQTIFSGRAPENLLHLGSSLVAYGMDSVSRQ
jgi:hypothetical protein